MSRYSNSVPQILDGNGDPIVGAKKFFFEPGTTTPKTIYTDSSLTTAADNPQLSDANGRYSDDIFLDGVYKEVQQDNSGTATGFDGVTLWTKDPVGEVETVQLVNWASDATYDIPDIVIGSDDSYYLSKVDSNQGNNPTTSPTQWAQITFVNDGVVDGVTTIQDSNSNESIIVSATASAVNEVTVTNAAVGSKPSIDQSGSDDVGLDIEGIELHGGSINIPTSITMPAGSIDTDELAVGAVTAGRIDTSAVTEGKIIAGAIIESKFRDPTAGTTYVIARPGREVEYTTNSTSAILAGDAFDVRVGGVLRAQYEIKVLGSGAITTVNVIVNGVVVNTQTGTATSYATRTYDVTVARGDCVQFSFNTNLGGNTAYIQNMRLYSDEDTI